MKKKVLILAGGYSKERDISLKTARAVYKQIKNKYFCKILDPKNGFIKQIKKFKPDVVFNALHGRYGEDGYIQLILENEKIKYTHSGVKASSICINKLISKKIFIENNILSPKYLIFKQNSDQNYLLLVFLSSGRYRNSSKYLQLDTNRTSHKMAQGKNHYYDHHHDYVSNKRCFVN